MHDGDELHSESGLYITGDVFDGGGDRVVSGKQRVYDDTKAFYLEISLVQGFKGALIVEIMVKWNG